VTAYEKGTDQFQGDRYADLREIIAKRIIVTALRGERDPERLCSSALASIDLQVELASNVQARA
jgi:hypothetical protein